jgi:hypothetical protein
MHDGNARVRGPSLEHRIRSRQTDFGAGERNELRTKLRGKLPVVGAIVAVCALGAAFGIASLASASSASHAKKAVTVKRVFIRGHTFSGPHRLRFAAPNSIRAHDKLKIINQTDPSKVGPHTFSMVKEKFIPQTNKEIRHCGDKGHICRHIFHWHKNGKVNPVDVGKHGWDVEGTLKRKGDSWFTGEKPGTSFKQRVAGDAPSVITFQCAIHPWMHGRIVVKH